MKEKKSSAINGKYCVIRTYSAGVHIGNVEYVDGTEVLLTNARRIFKWGRKALSLNEVSKNGIAPEYSKISQAVDEILITQAIEIIPATKKAIKTFEECSDE